MSCGKGRGNGGWFRVSHLGVLHGFIIEGVGWGGVYGYVLEGGDLPTQLTGDACQDNWSCRHFENWAVEHWRLKVEVILSLDTSFIPLSSQTEGSYSGEVSGMKR